MTGQRGRPRTGTPVLVRIPLELLSAVDDFGADNGWTRAEAIRILLDRALHPPVNAKSPRH